MKKLKYTREQLKDAIALNTSWRATAKHLGLNTNGGGIYLCLKRIAKENGFSTCHFIGQGHNKGKSWRCPRLRVPDEDLFCKDSKSARGVARKRIIKDNLIEHSSCSLCKIKEWRGKKLNMVLDHINGNSQDHRLENLRFICPNCNSQLSTFAGRNIGKNGD